MSCCVNSLVTDASIPFHTCPLFRSGLLYARGSQIWWLTDLMATANVSGLPVSIWRGYLRMNRDNFKVLANKKLNHC